MRGNRKKWRKGEETGAGRKGKEKLTAGGRIYSPGTNSPHRSIHRCRCHSRPQGSQEDTPPPSGRHRHR